MPHWIRTRAQTCRHPDGNKGLLQIYQTIEKAKNTQI
jgi:hypothetical protein